MTSNRVHSDPGGGFASSIRELFKDRVTLALLAGVLGAVGLILSLVLSQQDDIAEALAKENAAAVARSIQAFEDFYSSEVERRLAPLRNNPSFSAALAGLPRSGDLVAMLDRYRVIGSSADMRSFSGGGEDAFERSAAQSLHVDPSQGYSEVMGSGSQRQLRFALATRGSDEIVEVGVPVDRIAQLVNPRMTFWFGLLAAIVTLGLLGLLLRSRSSSSGMQRYAEAQEAAKGELEREVAERSKIEDDLRAQAQEVIQGVGVVSEAVSRILTSMTQVVSGATETAASVTEAATTVEQVKQTSQLSNQRASDVTTIAERAVQVSQTGEQSVQEAIEGMTLVRDQMQSIAESVLKLGDQSRAIGEIITAVSELAEQSNLLAINAAIEAAKAGEHGKGFGVVAQEVKALAEQSKQATGQVRTMLEQIQRAANVAVMVTEQGTKSAESGVKQSIEAGESIRVLANSIAEAAGAVGQISASSQQQLIGMDQVATAMQDIKEGSQENVASMREIESSVQNLSEVGASLEALVSRYVVPNKSSATL